MHHYRSMAAHALNENHMDGFIGIKKLFYTLRPLLACRSIERLGSQPPNASTDLLAAALVTIEEREWIEQPLKRKASAGEANPVELTASRASTIRAEPERYTAVTPRPASSTRPSPGALDKLLRTWCLSSAFPD
jgi:predicted nucleotidyltransferase